LPGDIILATTKSG